MNELDRYAVSLENMEVLRAQVESQAREIERLSDRNCAVEDELARNLDYKALCAELRRELAAMKAQASGVVLPPSPYMPGVDPDSLSDYERGEAQGRCDMWAEVYRINQSASAVDERAAFERALRTLPDSTGAIAVAIECFDPGQERYYKEEACSGLDLNSFFVVWKLARAALSANHSEQFGQAAKFTLGDRVRKTKGSQWQGTVVGTYSTALTPEGYAVESGTELGSVQIYPAAALEACE